MHAIMKLRMRRRDRYECDVPHPLTLDGKYHMLCSRENKQSRVYKIRVHYCLQNYSIFPLEVNWNTYGTCIFQVTGDTETQYILILCLGRRLRRTTQSCGCIN